MSPVVSFHYNRDLSDWACELLTNDAAACFLRLLNRCFDGSFGWMASDVEMFNRLLTHQSSRARTHIRGECLLVVVESLAFPLLSPLLLFQGV